MIIAGYVGSSGRSSVLALASDLRRLHLSHVIAHPLQLHGSAKEIELVQTGDIGIESLLGSWLYMLVHQGIIDPRGTLASDFLQNDVVNTLQQKDIFTDILVHRIVAPLSRM